MATEGEDYYEYSNIKMFRLVVCEAMLVENGSAGISVSDFQVEDWTVGVVLEEWLK